MDKPTLEEAANELLQWMKTNPFGKWLHVTEGELLYEALELLANRGDLTKRKLGDRWVFSIDGEFDKNLADSAK